MRHATRRIRSKGIAVLLAVGVFAAALIGAKPASADKFPLPPPPPLPGSELAYKAAKDFFRFNEKMVEKAARALPPPDMSVLMFLAREANRPLDHLVDLRHKGLPFADIAARVGLPPTVFLVPMPVDARVGPPYGKAHGYWKHHKHGKPVKIVHTDVEVIDLVNLRIVSGFYGVPAIDVIRMRERGILFPGIYEHYHEGRGEMHKESHWDDHPGKGKGKGRGRD
ncbi:MAG: hypothetical protein HY039_04515 [Nitrospirae bacterium]|nr:hypothetical protein [Nitrospirota bacterium]